MGNDKPEGYEGPNHALFGELKHLVRCTSAPASFLRQVMLTAQEQSSCPDISSSRLEELSSVLSGLWRGEGSQRKKGSEGNPLHFALTIMVFAQKTEIEGLCVLHYHQTDSIPSESPKIGLGYLAGTMLDDSHLDVALRIDNKVVMYFSKLTLTSCRIKKKGMLGLDYEGYDSNLESEIVGHVDLEKVKADSAAVSDGLPPIEIKERSPGTFCEVTIAHEDVGQLV